MGTRSDVAIAVEDIYAKKFEKFAFDIGVPNEFTLTEEGFLKAVLFNDIKWYEDFDRPEIDALMKFLKELPGNANHDFTWGFVDVDENNLIRVKGNPMRFGIAPRTGIEGPWKND